MDNKTTVKITAFQNSDAWGKYDCWWQLPSSTLDQLFIVEAEFDSDLGDEQHTLFLAYKWAIQQYGRDIVIVSLLADHLAKKAFAD